MILTKVEGEEEEDTFFYKEVDILNGCDTLIVTINKFAFFSLF